MTPQLTQLLVFVGIIAGLGMLIWAAQNAARKRGAAEAKAESESEARKAEQEMTDVVLHPPSAEETKDKLQKGAF